MRVWWLVVVVGVGVAVCQSSGGEAELWERRTRCLVRCRELSRDEAWETTCAGGCLSDCSGCGWGGACGEGCKILAQLGPPQTPLNDSVLENVHVICARKSSVHPSHRNVYLRIHFHLNSAPHIGLLLIGKETRTGERIYRSIPPRAPSQNSTMGSILLPDVGPWKFKLYPLSSLGIAGRSLETEELELVEEEEELEELELGEGAEEEAEDATLLPRDILFKLLPLILGALLCLLYPLYFLEDWRESGERSACPNLRDFRKEEDSETTWMELGSGRFGVIYHRRGSSEVAKIPLATATRVGEEDLALLRENRLTKIASQLCPDYVVQYKGVANLHGRAGLRLGYCEGGSLLEFLHSHPLPTAREGVALSRRLGHLLSLLWQTSSGMAQLSRLLVHRDLAARNLLLNGSYDRVRIGDFGLALAVGEERMESEVSLPAAWMAPESLCSPPIFHEASDVWSFGVVIWECLSGGANPFGDMAADEIAPFVVQRGGRLQEPRPPFHSAAAANWEDLLGLMRRCWETSPAQRASFAQLQHSLQAMLSSPSPYTRILPINPNHDTPSIHSSDMDVSSITI